MIDEKEGEKRSLFSDKRFLIISIILFFLFFLIIFFYGSEVLKEAFVCGDGTSYGNCSVRQPYFCLDGNLIERASICGCLDILTVEGDLCISKYQNLSKNITLGYTLRGKKGEIDLEVYEGMVDYVSGLPKSIHYNSGEQPSRRDFKIRNINNEEQRELLLPLVTKIQNRAKDKNDQVRIAISLIQEIPYGESDKSVSIGFEQKTNYSRYPYEVLYDREGICGEKSELLAFLLKEMGYEVVILYYLYENHESLGIRCPVKYSLDETGYCFIETSGPSIITNNQIEYSRGITLYSKPEIFLISDGKSLGDDLYEYKDAKDFISIDKKLKEKGEINFFDSLKLENIREKYGLAESYSI